MTTGQRNNFEAAVAYILPNDTLSDRQNNSSKRNQSHIFDTSVQGQFFGSKFGIGKTGVQFKSHKNHKYNDLNYYQKKDTEEWHEERKKKGVVFKRKKNNNNGGGPYKKQKAVAAVIENKFEEHLYNKVQE